MSRRRVRWRRRVRGDGFAARVGGPCPAALRRRRDTGRWRRTGGRRRWPLIRSAGRRAFRPVFAPQAVARRRLVSAPRPACHRPRSAAAASSASVRCAHTSRRHPRSRPRRLRPRVPPETTRASPQRAPPGWPRPHVTHHGQTEPPPPRTRSRLRRAAHGVVRALPRSVHARSAYQGVDSSRPRTSAGRNTIWPAHPRPDGADASRGGCPRAQYLAGSDDFTRLPVELLTLLTRTLILSLAISSRRHLLSPLASDALAGPG